MNTASTKKQTGLKAHDSCVCQDPAHLVLTTRAASRAAAVALLVGFCVFVAGYFLGHKKAIEQLSYDAQQEGFADQIHYSISSLYDAADAPAILAQADISAAGDAQEPNESADTQKAIVQTCKDQKESWYQAQLVSFHSKAKADALVSRLAKHGFKTVVVSRSSRTARGKLITWYQVVTAPHNDRHELEGIVQTIKQLARIENVRIVMINQSVGTA